MAERASDSILVDAPADTIMDIIVDFDTYPEWASNIREVEVRDRDGDGRGTRVWYRVDAKVLELEYTLAYTYVDERTVTWTLDEGEQLRALDGEYRLEDEGDEVRVHYSLEVDPTIPLPGFLRKRAAKQILESGLHELKRRAEALS